MKSWLCTEGSFFYDAKYLSATLVALICYACTFSVTVYILEIEIVRFEYPVLSALLVPELSKTNIGVWFAFVVLRVFVEETLFRLLPLVIGRTITSSPKLLLLISVISSILFGYIHAGVPTIFLNGVVGFVLCIVFLKFGGMNKKYTKALMVVTFLHVVNNLYLHFLFG